jgi:hypothetical protein
VSLIQESKRPLLIYMNSNPFGLKIIFLSLKVLRQNGGFFVEWLADILPMGLLIRGMLISALLSPHLLLMLSNAFETSLLLSREVSKRDSCTDSAFTKSKQ